MTRLKIDKFKVPITLFFFVIFFLIYPFLTKYTGDDLLQMAVSVVFIIIPCLSLFVKSPKHLLASSALALLCLVLVVAAFLTHDFLMINLVIISEFFFFLFTLAVVVKHIFSCENVSLHQVLSSILGYLLIAFLFAFVYAFASLYHADLLAFTYTAPGLPLHVAGAFWNFSDTLYFSLATLTSLGYGDLVPVLHHVRMLAALEAVVGQMYLAVFVARLVGLMISQNVARKEDKILREIKEIDENTKR
jgi:voltage-gated potassium channel